MADQKPEIQQQIFSIEKLYIKDASLEVPNAPAIFLENDGPQLEVNLHTQTKTVDSGLFEVTLTANIGAKIGDKTVFLVEVAQAGIFQIAGIAQEDMEPMLAVTCPNILFPYIREVVSDLVSRAGFPPVILAPVNFDVMYRSQLEEAQLHPTVVQ